VRKKLLQYLACPGCGGEFDLRADVMNGEEVVEGMLTCCSCKRSYPVTRSIPRIMPAALREGKKETADFFAKDWELFPSLDLRLARELMQAYVEPMKLEAFKNKTVLEAGCGSGRNLIVLAQEGAQDIIGLDLSESVDVAYQKTRQYPNIHLVQGDILNPPFQKDFDVIFSVGVLHHLPVPKDGFRSLVRFLKPGGTMAITVYGKENNEWIVKYLNPLRKSVFSRFQGFSLVLSFVMALFVYPLIRFVYKPLNEISFTKSFAEKRLFYNDFLYLLSRLGFKVTVGQIWDQITAPTANYHSKEEIRNWFDVAGLDNVQMSWRNKNCWNGVGVKG
jgi:SAM-dependent methyltransferase